MTSSFFCARTPESKNLESRKNHSSKIFRNGKCLPKEVNLNYLTDKAKAIIAMLGTDFALAMEGGVPTTTQEWFTLAFTGACVFAVTYLVPNFRR